jgi:histidyl-tRNA synthetase
VAQRAQPVRGMRDFAPPLAELRRRVANQILDTYAGYGFETIETPALEDLAVLLGSGGGENEKLIFKVLLRGARLQEELARGGELADMGLRFDLTVPLARFVANHLHELPMPFKAAHIAPVWRAERPQRGRYREFVQCDIDIVGEPGIAAEVELLGATLEALGKLGIGGCTVRLNDRRILQETVEHYLGPLADPSPVYIALDRLDRVDAGEVAKEITALGHDAHAARELVDGLSSGQVRGAAQARAALDATLGALSSQGYSARFDPALVRGLGYYTGQVFEIWRPGLGYSLAGGGRYDGMTARFGAPALPMCGISIGFERALDLVDPQLFAAGVRKVAVLAASDEELLASLGAAKASRARQPGTVVSVTRRARNTRKQREDLARLGYSQVLDAAEFLESLASGG